MFRLQTLLRELPTRLQFAAFGMMGCLAAAAAMELIFAQAGMVHRLNEHAIRAILFHNNPYERSTAETLKSGDIQLTLRWHNHNDLDLWCIDPDGEKIWYKHPLSKSWGQLDIDMNAGFPLTNSPVENIFWPYDSAPAGHYEVFVNYFARHSAPDPTDYSVRTLVNGQVHNYTGALSFTGGDDPHLVAAFDVAGGPWSFLGIRGGAWYAACVVGVWLALTAGLLACSLIEAQNFWFVGAGKPPVQPWKQMLRSSGSAALAGLVVGMACQLVYGVFAEWRPDWVPEARVVGWLLFGAITAGLLSRRIPNLPAFASVMSGGLAGAFGAVLYNAASGAGTGAPGRLLGAAIFGFAVGVLLYFAEERVAEPEPEPPPPAPLLQAMRLHPYRLSAGRIKREGER